MLKLLTVAVLIVVFVLGAALGFQNAERVVFHYVVGSVEVRVAVLVASTFVIAALVTLALAGLRILSLHRDIRRLRKQVRDNETELKNLRNLPPVPDR